jgi:hypothetical protein
MCTVTLYNFYSYDVGRKNYLGPSNRDVLHQPIYEDSDKIPEDGTSTYVLHLSGITTGCRVLTLPPPLLSVATVFLIVLGPRYNGIIH